MSSRIVDYLPGVGEKEEQPSNPPVAVSLGDLVRPLENDPNELLKSRYLCKGGSLLLVGPTGVGKSSFAMQTMLLWSLGRPAFGIEPTRPLKSLNIQAENDDGDLAEMRDGVVKGLELLPEQAIEAFNRIKVCREDARTGTAFFENTVRQLLEEHRPDLLWIDPVLAYLGGDASSQEVVSGFLRNQLTPLLREFNCGVVIIHHTNKPPKKNDGNGWSGGDFAYLGAGSAEWANWARAVLALKSTPAQGIFELHAGKRGGHLRWRAPDESRVFSQYIAHSKGEGEIFWRPATESEVESSQARGKTLCTSDLGKVLLAIPTTGSIDKVRVIELCKTRGIGRDKTAELIKQLIKDGKLHEVLVPRPGARPEVHLAHGPDPTVKQVEPVTKPEERPSGPPRCPPVMETGCQVNRVSTAVPTGLKQSVATTVATPQDDDVPSLGLLLLPGPLKGPVVTAGGSSSGLEEKDHSIQRQEESSNHASVLELPLEETINRLVGSPKSPVLEPTTEIGARVLVVDLARN